MLNRLSFFLSVCVLVIATACGHTSRSSSPSPAPALPPLPASGYKKLRIGLATNYPPLAFEQEGKVRGIEVDFARQLRADTHIDTEIVTLPWEDLIPALQSDRIDVIMSGMSMTKSRARQVTFIRPYMRVGQMCLIRAEDISRLASAGELFRRRWKIGFINGTTGEYFARKELRRSSLTGFDSIPDGVAALHDQRIDYFIHDAPTIWRITTDPVYRDDQLLGLFQRLTDEYLAWAIRKDDVRLKAFLDTVIKRWKANGTLQRVIDRWIKVRLELRPADALQGESGSIP